MVAIPKRPPTLHPLDAINQKQKWPPPHAGSVDPPSIHPSHLTLSTRLPPQPLLHLRGIAGGVGWSSATACEAAEAALFAWRAKGSTLCILRARVLQVFCASPLLASGRCDVCGQEPKNSAGGGEGQGTHPTKMRPDPSVPVPSGAIPGPRGAGLVTPDLLLSVFSCFLPAAYCAFAAAPNARIHHMRQIVEVLVRAGVLTGPSSVSTEQARQRGARA